MTGLSAIRGFAFDVDGVLTDGGVFCTADGDLLRTFDAKDGFAIRMAKMHGYPVAAITGGSSVSIRKRLVTSGMRPEDVYLGSRVKMEDFTAFCHAHGLDAGEVMFFGDDTPDCDVLRSAGIGVCPSDASQDAKDAADVVSERPGGRGCVRDGIERVLRLRGDWTFDAELYRKLF